MSSPCAGSRRIAANDAKDRIWTLIRLKKIFTSSELKQLARKSDVHMVDPLIDSLLRSKNLSICNEKALKQPFKRVFKLTRDTGINRPAVTSRGNPARVSKSQKMWMAMKALKRMTFKDLSLIISGVSSDTARGYLKALRRAGYLTVSPQGTSPAIYTFLPSKDTGFKCPMLRKDGSVYDQNTKTIVFDPREAKNDL